MIRSHLIDLARWYLRRNGWLSVSPFFRGAILADCVAYISEDEGGNVLLDATLPPKPTIITLGATVIDSDAPFVQEPV